MIDRGKRNILGVLIDAVDLEAAASRVLDAARERRPYAVTALAVHGVMTGVDDPEHRHRLNSFDLTVPDGMPVRWALNFLHGAALPDRTPGPVLTLEVCRRAAEQGLSIYLYGSRPDVLSDLQKNLLASFPGLRLAGAQPSRFRKVTPKEKVEIIETIRSSGASIVLVGLGCPRQEVWTYEHRDALGIPILAVGAAFDFHAGRMARAPAWMQRTGLEWVYRLALEPRRLWRRYILLNPRYLTLLAMQKIGLRTSQFQAESTRPPVGERLYG